MADTSAIPTTGRTLVEAERKRQIEVEGWSTEHDDEYTAGELALAAACYAAKSPATEMRTTRVDVSMRGECPVWKQRRFRVPILWPDSWSVHWWKPKSRVLNLIRAGALYLAEIDRLRRAGLPIDNIRGRLEKVITHLDRLLGTTSEAS